MIKNAVSIAIAILIILFLVIVFFFLIGKLDTAFDAVNTFIDNALYYAYDYQQSGIWGLMLRIFIVLAVIENVISIGRETISYILNYDKKSEQVK